MRNEAASILDSVRESISVAERAGCKLDISHHKICGKDNWGKSAETLKLVHEARERGVDVTLDVYPYTASMTAQIITPVFSGFLMDNVAETVLFPYAAIFAALAFVTMAFVNHGDAKPEAKTGLEALDIDD